MANPPDHARDDRRMHGGEKPGLDPLAKRENQDEVSLERKSESEESSTTDRSQESALGSDVATRSKA